MAKPMSEAQIENVVDELDDAKRELDGVADALENAGACETSDDLIANVDEAVEYAFELLRQLRELRAAAKKHAPKEA